MALYFDFASATAPTSSKHPAPTATRGASYTAPLALRFLYSFNAKVVITDAGTGYPHPTVAATVGTGAEFYTTLYVTGNKAGKIKAITVDKPGINYKLWNHATTPTVITISGGTGAGAVAKLVDVDDGVITAITAPNAFGDYLYGIPKISIKNKRGENGIGAGASAVTTVVDGDIDTITVTNGGQAMSSQKPLSQQTWQ